MGGKIQFKMFDKQEELVRSYAAYQFNIVNKSRQVGVSTTTVGYALWLGLFKTSQFITIVSKQDEDAKAFLRKIKIAFNMLPEWLKCTVVKDNDHTFELSTGSIFKSVASSKNAGRSQTLSLLILDEAAFIKDIDDIWKAAYPALGGSGQCICISTPNGVGTFFHQKYEDAKHGRLDMKNDDTGEVKKVWNASFIHWSDVPYYDDEWAKKTKKAFTEKEWQQEYEGDFISSGNTVINGTMLASIRDESVVSPLTEERCGTIRTWKSPKTDGSYIMGVDTGGTQDDSDYSTFCIVDIDTREVVCTFQDRASIPVFSKLCCMYGDMYGSAYMVIESTGVGFATVNEICWNQGYENVHMRVDRKGKRTKFPGFDTNSRTRPLIISAIYKTISVPVDERFAFNDERIMNELMTWVWRTDSRAEHQRGCHDDLLWAYGLAVAHIEYILGGQAIYADDSGRVEQAQKAEDKKKVTHRIGNIEDDSSYEPPVIVTSYHGDDEFSWLRSK